MTAAEKRTTLRDLPREALAQRLARGLRLHVGPFVVCFTARDPVLAACLAAHYPDYPLAPDDSFADARIALRDQGRWARWRGHPRVISLEDDGNFARFPAEQLLAQIEWGLNWCIAMRANQYLMLHGGVVAREEGAMILPGLPGAGKSTLTAYLMHRGWRLFSDEFTLLAPDSRMLQPFPRLIPLKNESIDVIAREVPEARFGPRIPNTRKGLVAHLCPGAEHLRRMHESAGPRLIVFPRYVAGAQTELSTVPAAEAFAELTNNAFNYVLLGAQGFELVADLVDATRCYRLRYSDLADANAHLTALMRAMAD
ncbi:MAG TPA: HprK-related kinase A [Gammaproteobacteria bacterium]|nr:HprK-related kinase A [Gammaproteobacteria bacterium]